MEKRKSVLSDVFTVRQKPFCSKAHRVFIYAHILIVLFIFYQTQMESGL